MATFDLLEIMANQVVIDNSKEVYRTYILVMAMTVGFLAGQFFLFYLPTIEKNKAALKVLQETGIPDLGPLTTVDAIYYGSFLQSAANFEDKSGSSFSLWMIVSHAVIVILAVLSENIYANQFKDKCYYQDITLEFKGLSVWFTL